MSSSAENEFGGNHPLLLPSEVRNERLLSNKFNDLLSGKINSVGRFQLTSGTSLVLENPLLHDECVLVLSPEAPGIVIAATAYGDQQATITWVGTHTGAWIRYVILG